MPSHSTAWSRLGASVLLASVTLAIAWACTESSVTAPAPSLPRKGSLVLVTGDSQLVEERSKAHYPVVFQLRDSAGIPVGNATITFVPAPGSGSVTPATAQTNDAGIIIYSGWSVGTADGAPQRLLASAQDLSATATARVYGLGVRMERVTADGQTAEAGATVAEPPAVRILDAFGTPRPGILLRFSVIGGQGTVLSPPAYDNGQSIAGASMSGPDGIARVRNWKLGTAGPQVLEVSRWNESSSLGTDRVRITATATPGTPVRIVPASLTGAAGMPLAARPGILVLNQSGAPVAGVVVMFSPETPGDSISGAQQITDVQGRATVGDWILGPSLGVHSLGVQAAGLTSSVSVNAVSGPAAMVVRFAGDSQRVVSGVALSTPLQVRVLDAAGRPVPNVGVSWSASSPAPETLCSSSTAPSVTDEAGSARLCNDGFFPVLTGVGTRTVTARVGTATASFSVTVLAAPASLGFLSPTPQAAVEEAAGVVLRARVLLDNGLPGVGYPVAFYELDDPISITPTSPTLRISPIATAITDGAGVATVQWKSASALSPWHPAPLTFRALVPFSLTADVQVQRVGGWKFATLAAGASHTCATQRGRIHCWGSNSAGQIGDGRSAPMRVMPTPIVQVPLGIRNLLPARGDLSCSIDPVYTVRGVTSGGITRCWGRSPDGSFNATVPTPVAADRFQIPGIDLSKSADGVSERVDGVSHACAVTFAGALYCWGANESGQVGDGTTIARSSAVAVAPGLAFRSGITVGASHTCAITTSSVLYCWGRNDQGQLGDGTTITRTIPTLVMMNGTFTVGVSAGASHTCAIAFSGGSVNGPNRAHCWGANGDGQLGIGAVGGGATSPQLVSATSVFATIAAGSAHTCAVTANEGITYCWGRNSEGQLGDGSTVNRSTPTPIAEFRP